jgi:predicted regulator of Ras-like GTPase activity (Roadblock/LC7/MglB family)
MPNRVYLTVCDALSNIVSRRAAENIVADALRGTGTNPDKVTALEMQVLLRGRVFARLQQIIPVAQAKGEIRVILSKLEAGFMESKPSPLSPEVLEGLEAIKAEFRMFSNSANPRVLRLADGIGALSYAADPIQALNLLWAELDLLQAEESGLPLKGASLQKVETIAPGASGVFFPDDQLLNPEFVLDLEAGFTEVGLIETDAAKPDAPTLTENLWIKDASQIDALNSENVILEEPEEIIEGLKLDSILTLSKTPVQQPTALKPARLRAHTKLAMTPEEQENLLSRFASQEGVIGVALCSRFGQVMMARLNEGSASHLSSVVAATVMVLEKSRVARLFYAQFENTSAFIAPFGDGILTVLANSSVNVGRVLSEVNALDQIMLQST